MKITTGIARPARIEILPLIDIVFLLLVFFIYAMLSMAVHRGMPVTLPASETARPDKKLELSVSLHRDGTVFLDRRPVSLSELTAAIIEARTGSRKNGVLVFADKDVSYQRLFRVLDRIREAGIERISLQAEADEGASR